MSSSSSSGPLPAASDWAALPRNVLLSLFTELGHHDLLSGAGLACAAWWRLARDVPALWCRIDLTLPGEGDDDTAEDNKDEEEEEGTMFSLFDDDDDGYDDRRRFYWHKTPAKVVADDGDLSDDDESSMFDLFADGEKTHYAGESDDDFDGGSLQTLFGDAPICPEKNNTPAEDDDGTAEEEDCGQKVSDEDDDKSLQSLHLFDDTDDDMEETPAKQDDDQDNLSDDDDDESMHGLFDDAPIDSVHSEKTPATDDDMVDDEDEEGTVDEEEEDGTMDEEEDNDSPVCQEETPAKDCSDSSGWKAMALAAINRSAGQCQAFWGRADDEVLLYLADRASFMKSLRLTSHYDVSSQVFTELVNKFPLLEELKLVLVHGTNNYSTKSAQPSTNSWVELFQSTCKACSHLQHFTVRGDRKDQRSGRYYTMGPRTPKPFSIPMMHGLRSFELSGDSSFTEDVVMQIVDKCPNLMSLNISDVRYRDKWELKLLNNKCYRIMDLKLPDVFYEPETDYSDDDMS
ncbi:unnamed protein product [Urochloa humidicola]